MELVLQRQCMVSIPPAVGPDLAYWKTPHVLSASGDTGGMCLTQVVGGQWPAHMSLHINTLELLKVIQHFAPLQNQHVLIRTDNKATAAYINRQGGVHSAYTLILHQSNVYTLRIEQRGGHYVEGRPSPGGLEPPS